MRTRRTTGLAPLLLAAAVSVTACDTPAEGAAPTATAAEVTVPVTGEGGDMADVAAVQAALEPVWPAFDAAVDGNGDFSALTEGQRAVAFAWVLSGLVGNGGFPSWIESMGHRTPEAQAALTHLGATEYVPLLDEAMRLYPTWSGGDPDERLSASEGWTDAEEARAEELDESFFELEAGRDLVDHYAAAYVAAHPDEFPT